jgi:hypothetical protein
VRWHDVASTDIDTDSASTSDSYPGAMCEINLPSFDSRLLPAYGAVHI